MNFQGSKEIQMMENFIARVGDPKVANNLVNSNPGLEKWH